MNPAENLLMALTHAAPQDYLRLCGCSIYIPRIRNLAATCNWLRCSSQSINRRQGGLWVCFGVRLE
ncbi:hypothetical protein BGI36_07005 [Snodgrassella communis]|uniref:hypothetical protein n=1 Tax=Snodgrassella communis TaxID=2946699 RepID=UPI000C1DE13B|nr:hypothetical protein [Snodgrassella communis]PIT21032.1 hypothetical protein BGI36_07005 [Snodgrassella communis]